MQWNRLIRIDSFDHLLWRSQSVVHNVLQHHNLQSNQIFQLIILAWFPPTWRSSAVFIFKFVAASINLDKRATTGESSSLNHALKNPSILFFSTQRILCQSLQHASHTSKMVRKRCETCMEENNQSHSVPFAHSITGMFIFRCFRILNNRSA